MKRTRRVAGLVLLLILLGLVGWWVRRPKATPGHSASGTFEAPTLDFSVPIPVKVLAIFVREGQIVTPGETLMVLDTTDLSLQSQAMIQSLRALEARMAALETGIQQLERDHQRLQSLETEVVPEAQVERILSELQAKRQEKAALEAQKLATEQQLARIRHQLQQLVLVSPKQAQVQTLSVDVGEYAVPGWPVITLLPLDTLEFHTYVPQSLLPTLHVGDTVAIDLDIPGVSAVRGWVTWIGAEAEYTPRNLQVSEERARLVYPVKVRVPNLTHQLKPGMTGVMRWGLHGTARHSG